MTKKLDELLFSENIKWFEETDKLAEKIRDIVNLSEELRAEVSAGDVEGAGGVNNFLHDLKALIDAMRATYGAEGDMYEATREFVNPPTSGTTSGLREIIFSKVRQCFLEYKNRAANPHLDQFNRRMDSMGADLRDMRDSLTGGRAGSTPDPDAEALAKGEGEFDAKQFQKLVKQKRVVDILVPSVFGGKGKAAVSVSAYGVPVFNYEGQETCDLFAADVKTAVAAWESDPTHNSSSTYTSATGGEKKNLVSIAKLSNRPLPGATREVYCVTTVTARGVSQSYISPEEYKAQIDQPLDGFYQAQKKAILEAFEAGAVAVSDKEFTKNAFAGVSIAELTERTAVFEKAFGKMKQQNRRDAEVKVDQYLVEDYEEIISHVADAAEKKRILDLLTKGDYKAVRASISDENGGLRDDIFTDVNDVQADWESVQERRNGVKDDKLETEYGEILNFMKGDKKAEAQIFLKSGNENYEELREYLLDEKGQLKKELFDVNDLKDAQEKLQELEELRNGAVGRLERHAENNYPAILKVLEEEKQRIQSENAVRKKEVEIQAKSDFLLPKYRDIIGLMIEGQGKKDMLELFKDGNFDDIHEKLFPTTGTAAQFDNSAGGMGGTNKEEAERIAAVAKNESLMQSYISDQVATRQVKYEGKIKELSTGIKLIKNYQDAVLKNNDVSNNLPPMNNVEILNIVKGNGLTDKLAEEIAKNNAVRYSEAFLEHKTQRSIARTTEAIALSPKEKKELNDSYSMLSVTKSARSNNELAKTLDMELPLSSFGGISFLNKSQTEVSVVFNDIGKGGNDIAYIHIPGTNQAYLRARVCRDENDPFFKGKHKVGDVVIEYDKVLHRVPKLKDDGSPDLDANGKQKTAYKEVDINSTYEGSKTTATKAYNATRDLVNFGTLGIFVGISNVTGLLPKLDSRSKGELEFGLDDWSEVQKRLKSLRVLAVSVNENGDRSVATMCNGEVINHSAGRRTLASELGLKDKAKKTLASRVDFDASGEKIEFTFDKDGNLSGGVKETLKVNGTTYYGNSRYVAEKGLKIEDVHLCGKVFVIEKEGDTEASQEFSPKFGDVKYAETMHYYDSHERKYKVACDEENKVTPAFVKYIQAKNVSLSEKEIQGLISDMKASRTNNSVSVSIKTEGFKQLAKATYNGKDSWGISGTDTYECSSRELSGKVEFGKFLPACSALKEDLLQFAVNKKMEERIVTDISDGKTVAVLNALQEAQQKILQQENKEGKRKGWFKGGDPHALDELRTKVPGNSPSPSSVKPLDRVPVAPEHRSSTYR